MIAPDYLTFGAKRYRSQPPASGVARYQIGEYQQAQSGNPAVIVLLDKAGFTLSRQWQYFLYAINPGMSVNAICALMGDKKALTNSMDGNGRNYITETNKDKDEPNTPKVLTFSRNIHTGVVEGDQLLVTTFDGNAPPPLKPGTEYPQKLADVRLGDYLKTPQTHPEMFLVCSNYRTKPGNVTTISPFDNGAYYPWADAHYGGHEIYSFFPLVSKWPVRVPLWKWRKLQPGEKASPYRRV